VVPERKKGKSRREREDPSAERVVKIANVQAIQKTRVSTISAKRKGRGVGP